MATAASGAAGRAGAVRLRGAGPRRLLGLRGSDSAPGAPPGTRGVSALHKGTRRALAAAAGPGVGGPAGPTLPARGTQRPPGPAGGAALPGSASP